MNIGDVAQMIGLPDKTIRYYEAIGLVKPMRAQNGYRTYIEEDVRRLSFVQRARRLGFTIEECRQLLSFYQDKHRASADVKVLALEKIGEVDKKMQELRILRSALQDLVTDCHGDDRPDCPILDAIADD